MAHWTAMHLQQRRIQEFLLEGAQKIMCADVHNEREAWCPLLPGSKA